MPSLDAQGSKPGIKPEARGTSEFRAWTCKLLSGRRGLEYLIIGDFRGRRPLDFTSFALRTDFVEAG